MTTEEEKKTYVLFIDDDRDFSFVPDQLIEVVNKYTPGEFVIARNSKTAIKVVKKRGIPVFMFLDHDLGIVDGKKDETIVFLNWFFENFKSFPEYFVHSQNIIGTPNMVSKIESFKRSLTM